MKGTVVLTWIAFGTSFLLASCAIWADSADLVGQAGLFFCAGLMLSIYEGC